MGVDLAPPLNSSVLLGRLSATLRCRAAVERIGGGIRSIGDLGEDRGQAGAVGEPPGTAPKSGPRIGEPLDAGLGITDEVGEILCDSAE
jgi:hypothetical protein